MKKHFVIGALMAAVIATCCGCMKEQDGEHTKQAIKFKATSEVSYITKTTYSGEVQSGTSLERIDWKPGDLIRIMSDLAATSESANYADYSLGNPTNDGKFSYSPATPYNADHGLLWGEGGENTRFFSVYPQKNMVYSSALHSSTASFTLPADQTGGLNNGVYYGNMELAYMTAAIRTTDETDVTLSFTPVITTFYITVTNNSTSDMTLQKVALTSTEPLTGSYTAELSDIDVLKTEHNARNYRVEYDYLQGDSSYNVTLPEATSENTSIYATFDNVSIPINESIFVALFAMPRNSVHGISGYGIPEYDGIEGEGGFISNLTLSITTSTGVVSLPLKDTGDQWIKFASEHKHNLTNVRVPGVSDYVLDVTPQVIEYDHTGTYTDQEFTVISHKSINGVQKAAPWKTQIQVGSDWVDLSTVIADEEYAWLDGFPLTSESTAEATTAITRSFQKAVAAREVVSHEERLRNGVVYDTDGTTTVIEPGSPNNANTAVDLSKYDFVNRKLEDARYTANTYIISAPGYYKIPIVYGNAIENNSSIPDSYTGRSGLGHLNDFICPTSFGTESSIHLVSTRPWLDSDRSQGARIHWEKYSYWSPNPELAAGGEMLTYDRGWGTTAPVSIVDGLSIETGSGNERFIVFHVDEENIRPGNWLIASTSEEDGSGNVCWSWQIWITDQDMAPITINNGSMDYSILPVNLGWTDLSKGQFYPQREATLRFASTEKSGVYSTHNLTVHQKEEEIVSTNGWSTFYQWGRKDPLTDGLAVAKDNDGYVHKSILHPNNMYYDKSSFFGQRYYDWTIHNYGNLWDSKNTAYESPAGDLPNHKTVYDPSPRRYCVPPDFTWDGFSTYGYESASSDGIYFYTNSENTKTVFFPASGHMAWADASSSKGDDIVNGYWTYHPYKRTERRASYAMSFKYNSSSHNVTFTTKSFEDNGRAYGYSVRPVYYGATIVPGLHDTELVFSEAGWTDGEDIKGSSYTFDGVTVTFDTYNNTSLVSVDKPIYVASKQSVKLDWYNSITVSVASGKQISEIVLEFHDDDPGSDGTTISKYSPDGGTYNSGSWYADNSGGVLNPQTNTVVFRTAITGYHDYRYIKAISVIYKD